MILELLLAAHLKLSLNFRDHKLEIMTTVDNHPEHRFLFVEGENDGRYYSSFIELRPDQRQYPLTWRSITSGEWWIIASLGNADGAVVDKIYRGIFIP